MAGGVALNCVANAKVLQSGLFENLWIQPASGDAGGALGAALAVLYNYFGQKRHLQNGADSMQGSFLGPGSSDQDVELMSRSFKAPYRYFDEFEDLAKEVAEFLDQGHVVGWHQGRFEWGPRALGNRSILADPRNPKMQKKLNLKVKYREGFRPFAPSVLSEDRQEIFDLSSPSPYMLFLGQIRECRRKPIPENYHQLAIRDKLYTLRSDLPAITHLDYSARIQTVHQETNPRFHQLLREFKEITGYGVLINTSFNVRGEPPVASPKDSYLCFMRTELDYLIINNFLFTKDEQPQYDSLKYSGAEFVLD